MTAGLFVCLWFRAGLTSVLKCSAIPFVFAGVAPALVRLVTPSARRSSPSLSPSRSLLEERSLVEEMSSEEPNMGLEDMREAGGWVGVSRSKIWGRTSGAGENGLDWGGTTGMWRIPFPGSHSTPLHSTPLHSTGRAGREKSVVSCALEAFRLRFKLRLNLNTDLLHSPPLGPESQMVGPLTSEHTPGVGPVMTVPVFARAGWVGPLPTGRKEATGSFFLFLPCIALRDDTDTDTLVACLLRPTLLGLSPQSSFLVVFRVDRPPWTRTPTPLRVPFFRLCQPCPPPCTSAYTRCTQQ